MSGVLRRHEVLRARFESVDGRPVQTIAPAAPFRLPLTDFGHVPAAVREREVVKAAEAESDRVFDLAAGGLFRAALMRLLPDEHLLVVTIHHIVFDGWSLGILFRELRAAYKNTTQDFDVDRLAELEIQYADFAAWQRDRLAGGLLAEQVVYWSNRLAGANSRFEFPLEKPRPKLQTFRGASVVMEIPPSVVRPFTEVARRNGATLFMALYAALRVVLSRHTGQQDLLVGTPVAGRVRSQLEPLIGCFINTLVLRTAIDENETFARLLRNVREDLLEALANQDLPFELLVKEMQPERDLSRSALIQVFFALQNAPMGELELEGLHIAPVPLPARAARYDLNVDASRTGESLRFEFTYATDLFSEEAIHELMAHFECLLRAIIACPAAKLLELDMLPHPERLRMVRDWNRTEASFPEHRCVHELIETQARRTPHAVALEFRNQSMTYAELDEKSTRLANHLVRLGAKVESLVGICLDRSIEMVVAVLGVMKAGAAYVPLDPGFPAARLIYMLADSAASLVVTSDDQLWRFAGYNSEIVSLQRNAAAIAAEPGESRPSGVRPENLAYVIYTSGSTGQPKGVMIPHRAVVNFLHSMRDEPGMTPSDTVLAVTTLSFDIAVLELYLPLMFGGRLVIADRETVADGRKLAEELDCRQATVMQATPATWSMLLNSGWTGDKRLKALCGGEALTHDLANVLSGKVGSLWNMYGPTETTVWSVFARIRPGQSGHIAIGRPIANTTVYILDSRGRPAPRGAVGQLHIGGIGLARGYKGRPELTGEAFLANPLPECAGERIYNTGDFARYRPDGQLECLGRRDGQVKIRGYRIELAEIESALRRHEGVRDALVSVRGDADERRLVAWIVLSGAGAPFRSEIQGHLRNLLPAFMVPSAFVFLPAFPMTPNGKVDRSALPGPDMRVSSPSNETVLPKTLLETKLLHIFEDLLDVRRAGVTDNFFDLGGHSLLATRLVTRIEKETGHNIPIATLFQAPTVRQLAQEMESCGYTGAWEPLVELRKGVDPGLPPLFCVHWLDAKLITYRKIASMLREGRAVYGLQPGSIEGWENPPETIKDLAAVYRREIRARSPHGPYHLAGSCLGGIVAFEIAQQFIAEGEQVGLLLLADAFMPGRLDYLHHRPNVIEYSDWYLGEFLLSPIAAIRRWLRESAIRLSRRRSGTGLFSRTGKRFRKINMRAVAEYQPQPYPGKITLVMCSDGPSRAYEDRRLGWSSVAGGGLEVHIAPGNHETMEQEPNLQVLGQYFQRCLDFAEASSRVPNPGQACYVSPRNGVQASDASADSAKGEALLSRPALDIRY